MSSSRVLIVDDDGVAVSLLAKILSTYGFDVTGTTDPFEGYELALEEYFDLILLDVMMPQLNGFALCRKIKQHEELQLIPVFFVSAYTAMDAELRAYEAGGDGIVAKPIEVQKIMSLLERVVPPTDIQRDNDPLFSSIYTDFSNSIN